MSVVDPADANLRLEVIPGSGFDGCSCCLSIDADKAVTPVVAHIIESEALSAADGLKLAKRLAETFNRSPGIPPDIRESINEVLQYSWQDEIGDFLNVSEEFADCKDPDEALEIAAQQTELTGQIFPHMAKVDIWLNSQGQSACTDNADDAIPDPRQLAEQHGGVWGQHPEFPRESWQEEVANGDEVRGYWEWVVAELEVQRDDEDFGTSPR